MCGDYSLKEAVKYYRLPGLVSVIGPTGTAIYTV